MNCSNFIVLSIFHGPRPIRSTTVLEHRKAVASCKIIRFGDGGSACAVTFRTNPDKSGQNPTPLRGTLLIINDFQPDIFKVSGSSPKEDLFIFSLRIGRN